jgi:hypothetical protein
MLGRLFRVITALFVSTVLTTYHPDCKHTHKVECMLQQGTGSEVSPGLWLYYCRSTSAESEPCGGAMYAYEGKPKLHPQARLPYLPRGSEHDTWTLMPRGASCRHVQ